MDFTLMAVINSFVQCPREGRLLYERHGDARRLAYGFWSLKTDQARKMVCFSDRIKLESSMPRLKFSDEHHRPLN